MMQAKLENENRGYFFTVTDQEITEHLNRSIEDIFNWLELTNKFVYELQTPEERVRTQFVKSIENPI